MCWNQEVSLNTFLFSMFVLLLIIYNNKYTQYKIKELDNIWMYLFLASFIFMQLIEFFIWRNINNKFYNHLFSTMAVILLIIQPVASLMMLREENLRNTLIFIYLLLAIPYSGYKFLTENIYSVKSKSGNLNWKFMDYTPIIWIFWIFFFLFSFFYEQKYKTIIFAFVTLFLAYYNYKKDNTIGSMWCWVINSIMIYYAAYLLLYLPFCEKKSIC